MQRRLAHEIALALTFKVAALTVLYVLFFSPDRRPDIAPPDVAGRLLVPADSTSGEAR